MNQIVKTVKVSSKGQITLPKEVRDRLKEDIIQIVADEKGVRLEPLPNLMGSLKEYAKTYIPFEEARDYAWMEETKRLVKHGRRRS
jgi:AbrB family looped-hinge helix DNA binding protein